MLVHADGRFEGSVSGGCVEGEVLHAAAETIADGEFRKLKYGVTNDLAWEVGLPCGGEIELMVQRVAPEAFSPAFFDRIASARRQGRSLAITTDLATGQSVPEERPGEDVFVNRYAPPRRLLIVGAVQIAQSLARIAREIDITPVLIDPRARFLTAERFPGITLDDRWPDEAVAAHAPDESTALVTLSHDIKIDDPALIAALASPAGYIGALGSKKSHAARLDRLRAAGINDQQLSRIDGPAGVQIGARGPAEIALSVAAGMVKAFESAAA
jgi:xanthine dehydrogenase accessory factor